jgi:hypothetical protein
VLPPSEENGAAVADAWHQTATTLVSFTLHRMRSAGRAAEHLAELPDHRQPALVADVQPLQDRRRTWRDRAPFVFP